MARASLPLPHCQTKTKVLVAPRGPSKLDVLVTLMDISKKSVMDNLLLIEVEDMLSKTAYYIKQLMSEEYIILKVFSMEI